ncbi:hypothetical protein CBS9595_000743 [Malassezia furfur]|nr:hypothetical protein CBS9595_000743 [Malassezia furfur]
MLRVAHPIRIPAEVAAPVGNVALTAAVLGVGLGLCAPQAIALLIDWARDTQGWTSLLTAPPLHFYLAAWTLFHLLEFLVTAYWNATHLQADSFLLQNGVEYAAAHVFGLLEFLVEGAFVPHWKQVRALQVLGVLLLVLGQVVRSLAMVHASTNFSHTVASAKRDDHVLVTHGVYRLARHPSYAGFFYWAVGTQILLGNPVSTLLFISTLSRFFAQRIRRMCRADPDEEYFLHRFFGKEYARYAARVPAGVPLVRFVT